MQSRDTASAAFRRGRTARGAPRWVQRSAPEEADLADRVRLTGDAEALRQLVSSHLGLVIRIASEFRYAAASLEDLIQEGNLGLTIAARRFDPGRGSRLATYATYWIRACILEHILRVHGPVRIGTTRTQRTIFFGLGRARRKLEVDGGAVDTEALAAELGVLQKDVEAMLPRLGARDLSLDAPRGGDDPRTFGAALATDAESPEELVGGAEEQHLMHQRLRTAISGLDARERAIIHARHLLAQPATLATLGRRFRISRERVRQLELRAKEKLRAQCSLGP